MSLTATDSVFWKIWLLHTGQLWLRVLASLTGEYNLLKDRDSIKPRVIVAHHSGDVSVLFMELHHKTLSAQFSREAL